MPPSKDKTVVLHAGGLRSLVATAQVVAAHEPRGVVLVWLKDGRASAGVRQAYVQKQAKHFGIQRVVRLDMPQLKAQSEHEAIIGDGLSAMLNPVLLVSAMSVALEMQATRIVWPAQCDGEYQRMALITEQVVLLQHLAKLERQTPPQVVTPMLELNDRELIELGGQLNVPWQLAWTCRLHGEKPCRVCESCRRRHAAFDAAGMVDPIEATAGAR